MLAFAESNDSNPLANSFNHSRAFNLSCCQMIFPDFHFSQLKLIFATLVALVVGVTWICVILRNYK